MCRLGEVINIITKMPTFCFESAMFQDAFDIEKHFKKFQQVNKNRQYLLNGCSIANGIQSMSIKKSTKITRVVTQDKQLI